MDPVHRYFLDCKDKTLKSKRRICLSFICEIVKLWFKLRCFSGACLYKQRQKAPINWFTKVNLALLQWWNGLVPACRQAGKFPYTMKEAYTIHALKSLCDGRIYVGFTRDINKRLKEHNAGKTKSTKGYRPWIIVYTETIETRQKAREKEKYLKSGIGKEFLKSLEQ